MKTKKISWKDPSRYISTIYINEDCLDNAYTQEIVSRAELPYSIVKENNKPNNLSDDFVANLTEGKKELYLCKNKGHFFKPCPGTKEYRCCDYQVLNIGTNCPIDCSYCILQAYLNTPWLTFFVNIEQLQSEISRVLTKNVSTFFRIGTGEFTDSLALDRLTHLSKILVPQIGQSTNSILELKTKSGVIENLEHLQHNNRTIISWSLNSDLMTQSEEVRAASLVERLECARQCVDWGYPVSFHFDPIIDHPGWEDGYRRTIEKLFTYVPSEAIIWISLGALRYIPALKEIGLQRFPQTKIYYNEFIHGLDAKQRYFRPHRVEMYKHIYSLLKKYVSEQTCIYFCMESDEIWQEVMNFVPEENGGLPQMLNTSIQSYLGNR